MSKKLKLISILLFGSTMTFSCGKNGSNSDNPSVDDPALRPSSGPAGDAAPAASPIGSTSEMPGAIAPVTNAINNIFQLKPLTNSGVPEGFSSWAQFNAPNDPESFSLQILDGKDAVKELLGEDSRCTIYIMAGYLDAEARPTYVVRTTFSHNNDTHPYILVALPNNAALTATSNGDDSKYQIFFKLNTAGDITSAQTVNLKWFHINHFDTGVCESLEPRQK